MKNKVLITGGAGYLGSVLAEVLLDKGYNVTVFDNLMYKQTSLLHLCNNKHFNFIKGDVTNKKDLLPLIVNNDVVIPLAAIVGAPACDANEDLATAINYTQIQFIVDNLREDQKPFFKYINDNLNSGGFFCGSISTREEVINGYSLHQTVWNEATWYKNFPDILKETNLELYQYPFNNKVRDLNDSFYILLLKN